MNLMKIPYCSEERQIYLTPGTGEWGMKTNITFILPEE